MAVTEQQKEQVNNLLRQGRKIEAIKYLRATFGIGLKEAKQLADHIASEMDPAEFHRPSLQTKPKKPVSGKGLGWLFTAIGIIMTGFAFVDASIDFKLAERGEITQGIVIDNPAQPTIEYVYNDSTYRYYSTTSSNPPSYEIGEEVELFVDPENHENVLVNTFTDRWLLEAILGGMGLIFTFAGLSIVKLK